MTFPQFVAAFDPEYFDAYTRVRTRETTIPSFLKHFKVRPVLSL
jgi:hypothetical protein